MSNQIDEIDPVLLGRGVWGKLPGSVDEYGWLARTPEFMRLQDHFGAEYLADLYYETTRSLEDGPMGLHFKVTECENNRVLCCAMSSYISLHVKDASDRPIAYQQFVLCDADGRLPMDGLALKMLELCEQQVIDSKQAYSVADIQCPQSFAHLPSGLLKDCDTNLLEMMLHQMVDIRPDRELVAQGEAWPAQTIAALIGGIEQSRQLGIAIATGYATNKLDVARREKVRGLWRAVLTTEDGVARLDVPDIDSVIISPLAKMWAKALQCDTEQAPVPTRRLEAASPLVNRGSVVPSAARIRSLELPPTSPRRTVSERRSELQSAFLFLSDMDADQFLSGEARVEPHLRTALGKVRDYVIAAATADDSEIADVLRAKAGWIENPDELTAFRELCQVAYFCAPNCLGSILRIIRPYLTGVPDCRPCLSLLRFPASLLTDSQKQVFMSKFGEQAPELRKFKVLQATHKFAQIEERQLRPFLSWLGSSQQVVGNSPVQKPSVLQHR